jgi:hypothetical protein
VLKTKGYYLEHNFGHGQQFLANFMITLNLLAFLFHTLLELLDEQYRLLRQHLVARQDFFNDLRALLRYMLFDNWNHLMRFMLVGLELIPDSLRKCQAVPLLRLATAVARRQSFWLACRSSPAFDLPGYAPEVYPKQYSEYRHNSLF